MRSNETRLRLLLGAQPTDYFNERITAPLGYWGERIVSQLLYAHELSRQVEGRYDALVSDALSLIEDRMAEDGAIVKDAALAAETRLMPLAEAAKRYHVLCVAHAHIDMNWMWPWQETVAVTIDTLRTMLTLFDEYPDFHFSQSQAAIYAIVETYAPELLEPIRRRVREGRWEVSASHWVEADKNMPSGESLTRQMLYAKAYLSQLLDLPAEELNLDFEPDTFGHSAHVPEILRSGGVRYYYHCRGSVGPVLYRWEAPSGRSVIAYREPTWYNDSVQPVLGAYVPDICRRTGLDTHLHVYGVGDHGGGPTRRDLERMKDMQSWPIYPQLRFGTYREFFALAEQAADRLPVVRGEQNFVFTGCYTSQSRIKTANREGEAALLEAELYASIAAVTEEEPCAPAAFGEAWRHLLFNQFHDILPGSGVIETREHAMGLFQMTFAMANAKRKRAMEVLAESIDTAALGLPVHPDATSAMGAGGGYGSRAFRVSQPERGGGPTRIIHVFNPSWQARRELVEAVVWDWRSPIRSISVRDEEGGAVGCEVLDQGRHTYWGHDYVRLLIDAEVPAGGYRTYVIEAGEGDARPLLPGEPRVDAIPDYVLENAQLRVVFCPRSARIVSMMHKPTGHELVRADRPGGMFRLIGEDASKGMTAWWIGRYLSLEDVHDRVIMKPVRRGELRQTLAYELRFGRSHLRVEVSLDQGRAALDYEVRCDWQEIGDAAQGVPQLSFYWPLVGERDRFVYDVPAGTVVRPPMDDDVPATSWAYAAPARSGAAEASPLPGIQLITRHKYGFRAAADALSLSLIRGSFDPDPYPETGDHHHTRFSVAVTEDSGRAGLIERAFRFSHPLSVLPGYIHAGTRPARGSYIELLQGSAVLSAVKLPEDGGQRSWLLRVYEAAGQQTAVKLALPLAIYDARLTDSMEAELPADASGQAAVSFEGRVLQLDLEPHALRTVRIDFADSSS